MVGTSRTPSENLQERMISLAPLLKILECPICLGMVKIPFKVCSRGHVVCVNCMMNLPKCPTCTGEFSLENPVCMKNLVESLPRPCPNEGAGCQEIVEPAGGDHQLFCGFKPVKCKLCRKEIPAYHLREHIGKEHSNVTVHYLCKSKLSVRANFLIYYVYFYIFDATFWLIVKKDVSKEIMIIDFEGVFSGKPTDEYFITLKFEKNGIGHRVTLKASENKTDPCEEEWVSSTKMLFSTIEQCVGDEGYLVIEYELLSKTKPT